jgi:hypothetical protein
MALPAYNLDMVQNTVRTGKPAGNPLKTKVSFR